MAITSTINTENHLSAVERIIDTFGGGKRFNVLVSTSKFVEDSTLGTTGISTKTLKFCDRQMSPKRIIKSSWVSIGLEPGGSIAWDLNVEYVVIRWNEPRHITISRLFNDRQYGKMVTLTFDPI